MRSSAKEKGAQALKEIRNFKRGAVTVEAIPAMGYAVYKYAGNAIASYDSHADRLAFSMAGWPSRTTAAHLRAISIPIRICEGAVYCGSTPLCPDHGAWYTTAEGVAVRTNGPR